MIVGAKKTFSLGLKVLWRVILLLLLITVSSIPLHHFKPQCLVELLEVIDRLLQQQQSALKDVLDSQKKSDDHQSSIKQQLHDLQSKVDTLSSQCSSAESETDKKRKHVVTSSLSVSVFTQAWLMLHALVSCWSHLEKSACTRYIRPRLVTNSLNQVNRKYTSLTCSAIWTWYVFEDQPRSTIRQSMLPYCLISLNNRTVSFLRHLFKVSCLLFNYVCIFINAFVVAIKRCYENVRRSHLEEQNEKSEFTEQQAKRRKYRSRRERCINLE